jgi:hypothetical protein
MRRRCAVASRIVRAGTVIFRDMRTGLRHEIRKDDIDRIITEFGASVLWVADASSTSSSNATSSNRRLHRPRWQRRRVARGHGPARTRVPAHTCSGIRRQSP